MNMKTKAPSTSSRTAKASAKRPQQPSRLPLWLTTERMIIGGIALFTIVILAAVFISTSQKGAVLNLDIEGIEEFGRLSASHQFTPVSYPQTPPVGGAHHPAWQQCGVYAEPITNEHAVHSLEHGAVWITYQPDLAADQVQTLADITRRGTHRLLSPYAGIDSPIVLSAWGVRLRVENASDPRINDFIRKYEQGPQTPELGASCRGGETRTINEIQLSGGA